MGKCDLRTQLLTDTGAHVLLPCELWLTAVFVLAAWIAVFGVCADPGHHTVCCTSGHPVLLPAAVG